MYSSPTDAYFPNEHEALFYHIRYLLGIKDNKQRFTFGHLVQVVKTGHWFEEPDQA
jgi:hypothetical protein